MNNKIIKLVFSKNKNATDELVENIKKAFYSKAGEVTVSEALGCLEIAKARIIAEIQL